MSRGTEKLHTFTSNKVDINNKTMSLIYEMFQMHFGSNSIKTFGE